MMKNNDYLFSMYAQKKYGVKGSCDINLTKNFIKILIYLIGDNAGYIDESAKIWLLDEQAMIGVPKEALDDLNNFNWKNVTLTQLLNAISPGLKLENIPLKERIAIFYHAAKALQNYKDSKIKLSTIEVIATKLNIDLSVLTAMLSLVEDETKIDLARNKLLQKHYTD